MSEELYPQIKGTTLYIREDLSLDLSNLQRDFRKPNELEVKVFKLDPDKPIPFWLASASKNPYGNNQQ